LIVTNVGWFFLSHRLPVALAARDQGFDVHIASGIEDPGEEARIRELGFAFHRLSVTRGGTNLFDEIRVVGELVALYRRLRPTLVHHVALKAVLYGGIAAQIAGIPRTVSSFTGMGYLFSAAGVRSRSLALLVRFGLRASLRGSLRRVIVQNSDDARSLAGHGIVPTQRIDLIRGSGVNLEAFARQPSPAGTPIVLLVARMLVDKGVVEFLDAAELLLARGVRARFVLVGGVDAENPASLSDRYMAARQRPLQIEWLGHRSDVAALLHASTVVCLPSYHEGLPKALLEAAATGRPMVATDIAGCREVVVHGVTGLLVPPREVKPLADAIQSLLDDPALCERLGSAARAKAEAEFGINKVVAQTLDVYRRLLGSDERSS
jgi:glycosyltransferase involved in cell wall biosynthesis